MEKVGQGTDSKDHMDLNVEVGRQGKPGVGPEDECDRVVRSESCALGRALVKAISSIIRSLVLNVVRGDVGRL
jgi:hypothetical protein